VFTTLNHNDAANFNEFPTRRFDVDSGHSDKISATKMSVLCASKYDGSPGAHNFQVAVDQFAVAKVRDWEVLCCPPKAS
jgi:hypothetical protein